eukprot:CAMPEP_0202726892 /NCGR_PEP_ID=MMETSP1385-20130828/184841_1 /ASSEMBLY_ACC=CAM_ASM_000861 /TAXON_ID=933848 /ORGANISM="Elphidium margaritaceum" /LENGTH=343 /DNA_ID=CAMNT_0049393121 /DNA_START=78 /DNA_END=1109 /DNA_ORIENTATION=-
MYVGALLLAFCGAALATTTTDSGEAFSWESDSADENGQKYSGLTIAVYKPAGGEPTITLGTDLDNNEKTFCLSFERTFEATGYNLSRSNADNGDYTEVDNSEVELSDANCNVNETSTTTFSIVCSDINGGVLALEFSFYTNADVEEGLEYTISLSDYVWQSSSADAQFVIVQELKDCSSKYKYSGDSGSDSDDSGDTNADTTDTDNDAEDDDVTTTDVPDRRRRLLDHDSEDHDDDDDDDATDDSVSDDGISSDDSDEYDLDYTRFIVDGQALDVCNGTTSNITSQLVLVDNDELHIVFERFECDLFIDPTFTAVNSDLDMDGGATMASLAVAVVAGFVQFLF